MIRQYSFVRLAKNFENVIYNCNKDTVLIFFGEIPNMPHHCIIMDGITKEFYIGYHTDMFEEIPEEET